MYHTKPYICFSVFFPSFISFRSVGTTEITIFHSFLAYLTISQRKRHYEVYRSRSSIGILKKLYPACTKRYRSWTIFLQIFKTNFLVRTLISRPNMNQIKNKSKKFQSWKSKILFSCQVPLNSEPFLHLSGSYDNGSTTKTTR